MTHEQRVTMLAKQALVAARLSLGMAQDDLSRALIRQATQDTGPRSVYTKAQLDYFVDHWRRSVAQWTDAVDKADVRYRNALMLEARAGGAWWQICK